MLRTLIRELREATTKWAYHGTSTTKLDFIRKRGLQPGAAPSYSDAYSEYDDGDHLFFSDDPEYLRGNYGDVLVRFPWPADTKVDVNKYGRILAHQFATKRKVPPESVEVEIDGKWQPLLP